MADRHRPTYVWLVLLQGRAILPVSPPMLWNQPPPPPQALSVHLFLTSGLKPSFPVYTPPSSSAMPSELHRNRQKVRSGLQATVCQPQAETIYLQYNY